MTKDYKESMMENSITKICKKCGKEKDTSKPCKHCNNIRAKQWRLDNPQRVTELNKKWYIENTEFAKEKSKNWIRNNLERAKESRKKWAKANLEKIKISAKKWIQSNPEKDRAIHRNWFRKNPEKARIYENTRRANCKGIHTVQEWKHLCEKYDNKCLCCGEKKKLTRDHIIPVSKGGSNFIENIQPLCVSCNSKKHDKEIDYRR